MFINGRYVKNKTILAAVENAYKGTVMVGKYPGYVINVNMPYECVDVNVHPAKTEVRFANDNEVFTAVYRAIKNALTDNTDIKQINLNNTQQTKFFVDKENIKQQSFADVKLPVQHNSSEFRINITNKDTFKTVSAQEFKETYINTENIVRSGSSFTPYTSSLSTYPSKKKDLFIPYEEPEKQDKSVAYTDDENIQTVLQLKNSVPQNITKNENDILYDIKVVGEIFNTYILCQTDTSLVIIDKHAAHERLLYEKLRKTRNNDNQMLLSPIGVNLSAKEKEAILNNIQLLEDSGFIIEDMGIGGVMVRAVPMNISCDNPQSLIEEIAHNLSEGDGSTMTEKQEWIYHSVACRSAIKAGDKATEFELKCLVSDILEQKIPLYCPHGRPVIISLTQKEIERQFGRA